MIGYKKKRSVEQMFAERFPILLTVNNKKS